MAHEENNENLSPEELKYRDLAHRGDDYFKIELYRWALHYYKLAEAMPGYGDTLQDKIALTRDKLRKETRSILTVLIVAAVVIVLVWLFS
ncbi:MAG TPA: hypothetical protein P5531_04560 [Bacteroidales bacterium]|nr:hypothetical protein [Bacteroidales bacterium]HSA42725.1 hypothetical protein [Bacteroidales bacterium]